MKKSILISLLIAFGVSFQSCQKDDSSISEQPNNISELESKSTNNFKSNGEKKTVEEDEDGHMIDCSGDPDNCTVFSSLPWKLANGGDFFDSNGDYISGSFSDEYTEALNHFLTSEVDGVNNNTYTVNKDPSIGGTTFIVFRDNNGDIVSGYKYD